MSITESERSTTGTYINAGSATVQDSIVTCTVMAYVYPTGQASNLGYVWSKCNSSGGLGPRLLIDHNSGSPRFQFGHSSNGGITSPSKGSAANSIVYNTWVNICATFSGTTGEVNCPASKIDLYVDASLSTPSTSTDGVASLDDDAGNDVFLLNRVGLGRHFNGDFAYFARWNRVLTTTEIALARTNGPLAVPSGLVEFWVNRTDLGPNSIAYGSRTTYVAGAVPPNTNTGDSTNFNVSITESASPAATHSSTFGATGVIAESASAAATHSHSATQSASITESASAADSVNGSASGDYTATQTEAGSAAETISQAMAATATCTEGSSAEDSMNGVKGAFGTLTESASAADSAAAAGAMVASVIEAATAAATQSQQAYGKFITGILKNISESPKATQAVKWTWTPAGRVGAMAGLSPVDGEGVTGSDGRLEVTLPLGQNGRLDVGIWNTADAEDDDVWTGFGAPA